jgi:DNA-directed RNA polymerase subunit K/omega
MDLKDECSNTITYNKTVIEEPTGNVYEAITIMAKRANQINSEIKRIDGEIRRVCYLMV